MVGRACQKDDVEVVVEVARGKGAGRLLVDGAATGTLALELELATALGLSAGFAGALARFLSFSRSFSRSFLSFLRVLLSSSSSTFSTAL